MENTPEKAEDCRLASLQPLAPYRRGKWAPGEDDYRLILSILDRPQVRINDLDDYDRGTDDGEDDTGSDSGMESDSGSGSCSGDGDEDDDEDENGSTDDDGDSGGVGDGGADIRAPDSGCDNFDLRGDSPRTKSEGGFVSHSARHVQHVVIEDDSEDDIQIIEPPCWKLRAWRSASATDTRIRRGSTRSESSMFVTPHPGERSTASATVSPSPRTMIDLTLPTRIKRSASPDPAEANKKKIKVDT